MPTQAVANDSDLAFAREVLTGNERAAADLRRKYHGKLVSMLCARGAGKTEAEDLIADLWSDCFGAGNKNCSILGKYGGRCALESWLITVATNRFVALKRRQHFRGELIQQRLNRSVDAFDTIAAVSEYQSESVLMDLLENSLLKAFSELSTETLLMLKLVHMHDVSQREIGRIWRWHESKVCRVMKLAREFVKKRILCQIKQADPWLKLTWEDFSHLCTVSPTVFGPGEILNRLQDLKVHQSKTGVIGSEGSRGSD